MYRNLFFLLTVLTLLSCGSETSVADQAKEKFKILVLYNDDKDVPYSWGGQHFAAVQYLEREIGDDVEVFHEELVPQDVEVVRALIDGHVARGVQMVFSATGSLAGVIDEIAADYPDTLFESCGGIETRVNLSVFFGRYYQPRSLTGLVAGLMTETGRIGYIGPFKFPQTIRGVNAFARGVRAANPNAEVVLVWGNTWGDYEINREITERLINTYGVDIISSQQSTLAIGEILAERGLFLIGNNCDMSESHGDTALISPVWNWGPYYLQRVKEAIIGVWQSRNTWGSLLKYNSMVKVSGYSPFVPESVRDRVNEAYKEIISGSSDVFWGPVSDNEGNLVASAGENLSDKELLSMGFLVDGIVEITE